MSLGRTRVTYAFMRRVDNWAGVPACLALGAWEAVRRRVVASGPAPDPATARRVLVIKFLGLGSIVEATPMIRLLRRRWPAARVSFLTFDDGRELAEQLGLFDEVRALRTGSFAVFALDALRALWWGRRARFDVSYDLEFFSKFSYIASYLVGARMRVGYYVRALRYVRLLTHPVPYNPARHVSEAFAAQIADDPAPADLALEPPPPSPAGDREAADLLARWGLDDGRWLVAVNVNTGELSALRRWPLEHFAELVRRLGEAYGAAFVFIGEARDRARVAAALRLLGPGVRAVNAAGATSLPGLLALLRRVRLLVSNDSGPLHLAALVGTPTVSFFGAESARVYGPRGGRHSPLDLELYCSPCLNVYNFKEFDCPYGVRCLGELGPDRAFAAARVLLGEPPPSPVEGPPLPAAACPCCGGEFAGAFSVRRGLALAACAGCGTLRQDPLPPTAWIMARHGADYHDEWNMDEREEAVRALKRGSAARWLGRIEAVVRPGRLLDVGCAAGHMLEEALARGWDASGVELAEAACRRARVRLGDRVRSGDLRAAGYAPGSFDAVTMFDLLEHVDDPAAVLAAAARVLRPGGVLAVTTPDAGSASRRILGARWPHYQDEHVWCFSRPGLAALLARAGFAGVRVGRAVKTVDAGYLAGLGARHGTSGWTRRVPRALRGVRFPASLGEMFVLARRAAA